MLESVFPLAVLTVFPAAMVVAGASDLFTMTISNRLTAGMTVAFFALAAWSGMDWSVLGMHVAAGALMLLIGIALFAPGWIGGGDAKLFAASALWLGWGPLLYYAMVASLAGGVLALLLLRYRQMPLPEWLDSQGWARTLHRADKGAPYGLALALAGLAAYTDSYWFSVALS